MITVSDLYKSFDGFPALDGVDLTVPTGSIYGLVGPNGSGKTTLIKHLTGVFMADQGHIEIDEQDVRDNAALRHRVAYIPDDLYFFPQANIKDMMKFYQRMYPSFSPERFDRLREVFDLDEKKAIRRFSRGMKKHVAFMLTLSFVPDIYILDEPMDGLDPVARRKVWNLLFQEVAERQCTVVVSSHNLRELEDVCDHVGIMHQGKVVLERSLDELQSNIFKFQTAYRHEAPDLSHLNILAVSHIGSVLQFIIRGDKEHILGEVQATNPLMIDVLPLSLEEIFIHELGGMDYAIKDIIL
ncbi:MAG: ABC transporter ATP-binding protein [Syntrophomonadaceae bacterium]|nr:ABC transporter ATP-binding protein [Syntrophomonadaceae bacterium]